MAVRLLRYGSEIFFKYLVSEIFYKPLGDISVRILFSLISELI